KGLVDQGVDRLAAPFEFLAAAARARGIVIGSHAGLLSGSKSGDLQGHYSLRIANHPDEGSGRDRVFLAAPRTPGGEMGTALRFDSSAFVTHVLVSKLPSVQFPSPLWGSPGVRLWASPGSSSRSGHANGGRACAPELFSGRMQYDGD